MAIGKKNIFGTPPKRSTASKLHMGVLSLLRDAYPGFTILEEKSIDANVSGRVQKLPVDLLLKELRVAIEVQGEQHFHWVTRFHKTPAEFDAQKRRDAAKAEAIVESGWTYLAIRFDEIATMTPTNLVELITKAIEDSTQ